MSVFLLDVNVLVALLWPAHESHSAVQEWFSRHAQRGWATCPFTETGFIRILSNPAFSLHAVTPHEALLVLSANLRHRAHRFWGDTVSYVAALDACGAKLSGHRQVTDSYLLGLAIHNDGKLATLDQAIGDLLPENHPNRSRVALIGR